MGKNASNQNVIPEFVYSLQINISLRGSGQCDHTCIHGLNARKFLIRIRVHHTILHINIHSGISLHVHNNNNKHSKWQPLRRISR